MIIYQAVNRVNGKVYVGQTARSLNVRIAEHLNDRSGRMAFTRALKKYGVQAFDFSVLETCSTREALSEAERFWIARLNSRKPNGYNITDGGEGTAGLTRDDTATRNRKQIGSRNPMYGRKHTEAEKRRDSELLSGARNPRFGKRWTPEQRALISERTRAAMQRPEVKAKFLPRSQQEKSPEVRRKISEAHKRNWSDPQFRASRVPQSEETRRKRSDSLRATHAARLREQCAH